MHFPDQLFYTKAHEWISAKRGEAKVGVTSYAVEQLVDIHHIDLPNVGDEFEACLSFGTIESTKTASHFYCPAGGQIVDVNKEIADHPELIEKDPYRKGWLVKVAIKDSHDATMDAEEYENYCKEE